MVRGPPVRLGEQSETVCVELVPGRDVQLDALHGPRARPQPPPSGRFLLVCVARDVISTEQETDAPAPSGTALIVRSGDIDPGAALRI